MHQLTFLKNAKVSMTYCSREFKDNIKKTIAVHGLETQNVSVARFSKLLTARRWNLLPDPANSLKKVWEEYLKFTTKHFLSLKIIIYILLKITDSGFI